MAFKRGNGKNNASVGLKDLYIEYKSESKKPVEYGIYSEFLKEYNKRMMDAMIFANLEYKLPYSLGTIRIQRRKKSPYVKDGKLIKRHLCPDWKKTLDSWREKWPNLTDEEILKIPNKKVLRHHNDHTNGYSVRFLWDKRFSNAIGQSAFVFKANRTIKENLAKYIKKYGTNDFFE